MYESSTFTVERNFLHTLLSSYATICLLIYSNAKHLPWELKMAFEKVLEPEKIKGYWSEVFKFKSWQCKKIKPSTLLSYIHIFEVLSKYYTIINITWIRLELDSDHVSKVSGLSLADEKNVVERGELIEVTGQVCLLRLVVCKVDGYFAPITCLPKKYLP